MAKNVVSKALKNLQLCSCCFFSLSPSLLSSQQSAHSSLAAFTFFPSRRRCFARFSCSVWVRDGTHNIMTKMSPGVVRKKKMRMRSESVVRELECGQIESWKCVLTPHRASLVLPLISVLTLCFGNYFEVAIMIATRRISRGWGGEDMTEVDDENGISDEKIPYFFSFLLREYNFHVLLNESLSIVVPSSGLVCDRATPLTCLLFN